ncbi:hypothetical protein O3M35_008761 [Rhynocoris fuscipes]|uniref:Uncharacterized protein n=1 Tax=Rhynocoris fuscipes TaxID=488301 RepID=A0AAW1D8X6_9HEMI
MMKQISQLNTGNGKFKISTEISVLSIDEPILISCGMTSVCMCRYEHNSKTVCLKCRYIGFRIALTCSWKPFWLQTKS